MWYTTLGLEVARQEIETGRELQLKQVPHWLIGSEARRVRGRKGSTIVITVGSQEEARKLLTNGIHFGGTHYSVE